MRGQLAAGDDDGIREWNDSAREDRRRLLESDLAGGEVHELRVLVPNRPGIVAEIALALGRATIDIVDMGLYPSSGSHGTVALWIRGGVVAEQAERLVRGLGLEVVATRDARLAPRLASRRRRRASRRTPPMPRHFATPPARFEGRLRAPGDKSMSHRAALFGAMCAEPVQVTGYLEAADTLLDAQRGARAAARWSRRAPTAARSRSAARGCARAAEAHIDVGNAGTLMRLAPGWLAGQPGGEWSFDGDASIRRRPVDRVAHPLREMGAWIEATDDRFAAVHRPRHAAAWHRVHAAGRLRAGQVVRADGRAAGRRARRPSSSPSRAATTPSACSPAPACASPRDGDRIELTQHDELELGDIHVPGDPSSAAFHIAAAILVKGSRIVITDMSANWTRTGLRPDRRADGRGRDRRPREAAAGQIPQDEPVCELDVASGPLVGTVVEPHEVPLAIDELPLVALLGCFAEGETVVTGAQELRVKESDRIATVVDGLRGLGADDRGHRGRLRRHRHRRPARRDARTPTATTAWRCSARSPASPAARASRSTAWTPRRSPTRASSPTSRPSPADMEVGCQAGRRCWRLVDAVGRLGARGSRGGASGLSWFGGGARLIFEGWVPHDPVFVAVRGQRAGAATDAVAVVAHSRIADCASRRA